MYGCGGFILAIAASERNIKSNLRAPGLADAVPASYCFRKYLQGMPMATLAGGAGTFSCAMEVPAMHDERHTAQ
jgi:hypothetical protein